MTCCARIEIFSAWSTGNDFPRLMAGLGISVTFHVKIWSRRITTFNYKHLQTMLPACFVFCEFPTQFCQTACENPTQSPEQNHPTFFLRYILHTRSWLCARRSEEKKIYIYVYTKCQRNFDYHRVVIKKKSTLTFGHDISRLIVQPL